jgi:arylsulfatase A-like enzyme
MNTSTPAPRRRNVIVICADDLRFDAVGYTGNPQIQTPHLDALAARSVRFSHAFTTLAICSPSRAALLTGRYGSANGVTKLDAGLHSGERTFAHCLRDAGHRTGLVGKWHLANSPQECGFEDTVYFVSNGSYYNRDVFEHGTPKKIAQHIEIYNAQQAIDFMQRAAGRDEPFVLFLCPQLPHLDHRFRWDAKEETLARYANEDIALPASWNDDLSGKPPYLQTSRSHTKAVEDYGYNDAECVRQHTREYYAVVTDLDAAIGEVLGVVDEMNLYDETLVVVTSDHGFFLGEHRLTSKVLPYEESIRIPLLVAAPGIAPHDEDRLVLNVDLMPTILEWAGLPMPANLHGHSLLPLMRGEAQGWRSSFLYEAPQPELGVWPNLAVRTDRWKYIETFAEAAPSDETPPVFTELYDLQADPHEMSNRIMAPEYREVKERLKAELERHRHSLQTSHE